MEHPAVPAWLPPPLFAPIGIVHFGQPPVSQLYNAIRDQVVASQANAQRLMDYEMEQLLREQGANPIQADINALIAQHTQIQISIPPRGFLQCN